MASVCVIAMLRVIRTSSGASVMTLAPELVRMTLNMAMTHTDATRSVYGKRLVYGGHTISIAGSQLARAVPNLVTILAWEKCDHVGPVFEEDILARISSSNTGPTWSHFSHAKIVTRFGTALAN